MPYIAVSLRETLNPKLLGYSLNSLLRRVLFPEPDGPATTRGRGCPIPVPESDTILLFCSFGAFFKVTSGTTSADRVQKVVYI